MKVVELEGEDGELEEEAEDEEEEEEVGGGGFAGGFVVEVEGVKRRCVGDDVGSLSFFAASTLSVSKSIIAIDDA